MESVGVIGLGLIGGALVRRLVHAGVVPVVYDLKPAAIQQAESAGALGASSAREVAERSELILICVQTDQQCFAVLIGDDGVLAGARPHACVAVLATVLPDTILSLAEQAAVHNVHVVDTPVAGRGMFSVEEGTMSALVGDDGALYERLQPILRLFASQIVSAGPIGSGAALKLAHNIVVYAGFAAMIEAVELARAAGVNDGLVEQVTKASGALSDLSAFHIPFYKHLRDQPHACEEDRILRVAAELLHKDLNDAVALGGALGIALPVAELLADFGPRIFPTSEQWVRWPAAKTP